MWIYLYPTDVYYSLYVGSLCRFIQEVFDDSILVVQPETIQDADFQNTCDNTMISLDKGGDLEEMQAQHLH